MRKDFELFAREVGIPDSVYEERCYVDSADVCGGEGNTCAPDDAPSDWDTVLNQFRDKFDYDHVDVSELRSEVASVITKIENRLPGPPQSICLMCGAYFGVPGGHLEGEPLCPNCEESGQQEGDRD